MIKLLLISQHYKNDENIRLYWRRRKKNEESYRKNKPEVLCRKPVTILIFISAYPSININRDYLQQYSEQQQWQLEKKIFSISLSFFSIADEKFFPFFCEAIVTYTCLSALNNWNLQSLTSTDKVLILVWLSTSGLFIFAISSSWCLKPFVTSFFSSTFFKLFSMFILSNTLSVLNCLRSSNYPWKNFSI